MPKRDGDAKITEYGDDGLPGQLKPVTGRRRCEKGKVGAGTGAVGLASLFVPLSGWMAGARMC